MVSDDLKEQIDNFVRRWISEVQNILGHDRVQYLKVENVGDITYVIDRYINPILNLEDSTRLQILEIMDRSLDENRNHGFWERWLWACIGIATYLLKYNSRNEIDDPTAADVIVRLSRWHHTRNNFWIRFQLFADNIVNLIWIDIENLYYLENIH